MNKAESISLAEKMFNELGWEKTAKYEYELGSYLTLYFHKESKWWSISNYNMDTTKIDVELHKAITQQMKELGWLDE